jgi:hypothetical protein
MGYELELHFPPERLQPFDRQALTEMLCRYGVQMVHDSHYDEPVLLAPATGGRIWLVPSGEKKAIARGCWADIRFGGTQLELVKWLNFALTIGCRIHDPHLQEYITAENSEKPIEGYNRLLKTTAKLFGTVREIPTTEPPR